MKSQPDAITESAVLTRLFPNTGQIESNYDETVDSFDEMNLKSELLRGKKRLRPKPPWIPANSWISGIYAYGFERPSAIQQRAIMPVIKGKKDRPSSFPAL